MCAPEPARNIRAIRVLADAARSVQSQASLTLTLPPRETPALANEVEAVKPEWEPRRRPVGMDHGGWSVLAHVRCQDKYVMGYTATLTLGLGRLLTRLHSGMRSQWVLLAIGWRRATSRRRTG